MPLTKKLSTSVLQNRGIPIIDLIEPLTIRRTGKIAAIFVQLASRASLVQGVSRRGFVAIVVKKVIVHRERKFADRPFKNGAKLVRVVALRWLIVGRLIVWNRENEEIGRVIQQQGLKWRLGAEQRRKIDSNPRRDLGDPCLLRRHAIARHTKNVVVITLAYAQRQLWQPSWLGQELLPLGHPGTDNDGSQ